MGKGPALGRALEDPRADFTSGHCRRGADQTARRFDFGIRQEPPQLPLHHRRRDRPDGHHRSPAGGAPNEGLPNKGPGRAPDGNFVLTEIEVFAAPKADPKQVKPVKLQTPLADFSQEGYPVDEAIDGDRTNQGAGWAVSPATGVTHWATFETATPVGKTGGTMITVKLHHRFNQPNFTLGRFRLAVTRLPRPIALGISEEFRPSSPSCPNCEPKPRRIHSSNYNRVMDATWRKKQAGARRHEGSAAN